MMTAIAWGVALFCLICIGGELGEIRSVLRRIADALERKGSEPW